MADVLQLSASQAVPRQWLGDRAYYLSQLAAQPEPILPGVVVSARLLREFWENNPWSDPLLAQLCHSTLHLPTDEARQLQAIAQQIRQALLNAELPEAIADNLAQTVQSLNSDHLIFHPSLHIAVQPAQPSLDIAAIFDSHVSSGDRASLSQTLKQTWAELFRARSLLYWQRAKIPLDRVYLAVLIQPLGPTTASGLLNLRPQVITIIATGGLPQSLVDAYPYPERYQIDTKTGQIQHHEPGNSLCHYHLCPSSGKIELVAVNAETLHSPLLRPDTLLNLRHHAQRLQTQGSDRADLEWVLTRLSHDSAPTWYISQYYPQGSANLTLPQPNNSNGDGPPRETQLQGIGASSGQVYGIVSQLTDGSAEAQSRHQILVVPHFEPQDAPACYHIIGLITEQGSRTSHGAIWARELGIPAVMGVPEITQQVRSGQPIYLDGDRGQVYLNPPQNLPLTSAKHPSSSPLPTMPQALPVHGTELFVSFSQPHLAASLAQLPVDGVGLIRSELLAQGLSLTHLSPKERLQHLSEGLTTIAEAFAPRPVYYRSVDGGRPGQSLGLRGTLAYRHDATRFDEELTALAQVRQAGSDNLHLILPFVRSVAEFNEAQQRIQQQGLGDSPGFQCWLMAEVPSVTVLLDDYVKAGVQGLAIGSHDLSQLILGFDRDDPRVAAQFDVTHPAVLDAIARLAAAARRLQIPCTLCADSLAPTDRDRALDAFVRCGVTGLSLSPENLERQAQTIARAEQRLLLEQFWNSQPKHQST